jgi:gluconokinase
VTVPGDIAAPFAARLPPVIVMGVAGCGKTVVGEALAASLGGIFVEGDRLHPPRNVALMSAGTALTDADRAGWLDAVGAAVLRQRVEAAAVVAACSALKRAYRNRLRGIVPDLVFVHLDIDRATARARVAGRKGHFMPASLVDSQFAALEPLQGDEAGFRLDATGDVAALVEDAAARLRS